MLMKLTPGVNFINILRAAKNALLYEKCVRKMLMMTPVVDFNNLT